MNEFFVTHTNTILVIINIILAIMVILNQKRIKSLELKMMFIFNKIDLIDANLMHLDYGRNMMSLDVYVMNLFARIKPEEKNILYHMLYRSKVTAMQLMSVIKNHSNIDIRYLDAYKKYINDAEKFYKE